MNIWNLISQNTFQKPHTQYPDDLVPLPDGFRGNLLHDAALCTACETCAYVCSPAAITFDHSSPDGVNWEYQPFQCTYCGRCVEYCPTHALSFDESTQPEALHDIKTICHNIPYQICPRCGEKVIPLPSPTLSKKGPVSPEIEQLNRLCARCRKKAYSELIKRGFTG